VAGRSCDGLQIKCRFARASHIQDGSDWQRTKGEVQPPVQAAWAKPGDRTGHPNRAKSHRRGKPLKSKTPAVDAFACNEVRLLIACLAYQVMHIARRVLAKATGTGWSLRRLRERVLRAGARLTISGRRMTLAISSAATPFWQALWPGILALHWSYP
jgi:hypothetical protein